MWGLQAAASRCRPTARAGMEEEGGPVFSCRSQGKAKGSCSCS